jgi:cell division protein FtsB
MEDKFTIIFESLMNSLDAKRGKLVTESYADDLWKKEEEAQRKAAERKAELREHYRTLPAYKRYIKKVNLVYKNLDKLLSPWVDKPFVGFDELKYPGIKSDGTFWTYDAMIRDLKKIASYNKMNDFLDISQNELESMITKLEKNPYLELAHLMATKMNNMYIREEDAEEVKKLYDTLDPKPQWVDFEEIERGVAKQKERIKEYEDMVNASKEEKKKLEEWANTVEITDDIRKQWFKNYGFMNGWSDETENKWEKAKALHAKDLHDHPELHTQLIQHNDPSQRGINNYIACDKCGLKASWDSSD